MENRLFVYSEKERACVNAFCLELCSKGFGIHTCGFIKDYAVHPINLPGPGFFNRKLEAGDALEAFRVGLSHPAFPGDDLFHTFQLAKADGRLHVGEAEIVAKFGVVEAAVREEAEIAQASCLLRIGGVIGEDHAAFAGGDELVGVKAEDADVAQAATAFPLGDWSAPAGEIFGPVDLGGVFDDLEIVFFGEFQDRVHVHGMAIDMHGHNGFQLPVALFYFCFDLFPDLNHVHAPSAGIAIHKDRNAAVVDDRLGTGDDGEGGHNDLVARFQANAADSRLEGRGAIAHGDAVFHAAIRGPFLLEFFNKPTRGGNPTGAEALVDVFNLSFADQGFVNRNEG